MSPHLAASRAVLEEILDALEILIRPLDEAALNWAPLDDEANAIAAMVRHTAGSLDSWISRAVGEHVERDREAEFRYRGGAAELLALVAQTRAEARRRITLLEGQDLSREVTVQRTVPTPHEAAVSAAWCLEHALVHAAEHWGQIQLTAQLYARRSG